MVVAKLSNNFYMNPKSRSSLVVLSFLSQCGTIDRTSLSFREVALRFTIREIIYAPVNNPYSC